MRPSKLRLPERTAATTSSSASIAAATGSSSGPAVADARRAAVAREREPQLGEGRHEPGPLEVAGDGLGSRGERGLHDGGDGEAAGHGVPREQARPDHDGRVGGVRARGDRGDRDGRVADLRRLAAGLDRARRDADGLGIRGLEVVAHAGEGDAILRPAGPGEGRLDGGEVQLEQVVEDRAVAGLAPQALGLRVALDEVDALRGAPREPEIRDRLVVDREQRGRRPELRAHVRDRRAVGEREPREPVARELDERPDHAERAEHLRDHEHEVGRRRDGRQLALQPYADDPRHGLVQRLAKEDGLGLDPADAIAQDAEPVDHRGVRVRPDERVRERDAAGLVGAVRHDGCEVLEVDLVDDAGARRDDPQVAERGLRPAQELVALPVALVLAPDVEGEGSLAAPRVDLDGVVDDQVRGHERVDPGGIAAQRRHRVAHRREVDDRRHTGEVLEDDPRGHERDLRLAAAAGPPCRERGDVLLAHDPAARVSQRVLEQDLERDGSAREVDAEREPGRRERLETVEVGEAGAERGPGSEGVGRGHVLDLRCGDRAMRVRPRTARYTSSGESVQREPTAAS